MQRDLGAMLGIYGNTKTEAVYGAWQTGPHGKPLDGSKRRLLRYPAGQLPPVKLFWSITMYKLPQRLLVDNPIQRYSIGDRTPGLKAGQDGSLEIYLQHDSPGPDKESNWLPTPKGPVLPGQPHVRAEAAADRRDVEGTGDGRAEVSRDTRSQPTAGCSGRSTAQPAADRSR